MNPEQFAICTRCDQLYERQNDVGGDVMCKCNHKEIGTYEVAQEEKVAKGKEFVWYNEDAALWEIYEFSSTFKFPENCPYQLEQLMAEQ